MKTLSLWRPLPMPHAPAGGNGPSTSYSPVPLVKTPRSPNLHGGHSAQQTKRRPHSPGHNLLTALPGQLLCLGSGLRFCGYSPMPAGPKYLARLYHWCGSRCWSPTQLAQFWLKNQKAEQTFCSKVPKFLCPDQLHMRAGLSMKTFKQVGSRPWSIYFEKL